MRNTIFLVAILSIPACGGSSSVATTPTDAAAVDPDATAGDTGAPGGSDAKASAALCGKPVHQAKRVRPVSPRGGLRRLDHVLGWLTLACTEQSRSTGSGMTEASLQQCADALDTAACKDVFANNIPACTVKGTGRKLWRTRPCKPRYPSVRALLETRLCQSAAGRA